jgi:hypothetical protein
MLKKQLFSIALVLLFAAASFAQTAQVQVIHNCADTAAAQVDIYINGNLALDNFGFRKATPFLSLPAGVNISIGVALANSTSVNDTLVSFDFNLVDGEKYIIVASGIVSTTGYAPSQPFSLAVFAAAQLSAGNPANTNVLVYHGATDAPIVDITSGGNTLVNNISYGGYSTNYLQLPTADYNISVTDSSGTTTVATYVAPLSTLGLQDSALVVLASGFLNPSNNSNGAAFGLWAALPAGGDLIELPLFVATPTAMAQIIHNCADTAAAEVDVYINGTLQLDDFGFRKATPFLALPAGVNINVGIALSTSSSINDTLVSFNFNLADSGKYVIVASGIVSTTGYTPSQPFSLAVFAAAQLSAGNPANTNVLVYHGATDAPIVDITSGGNTLVNNISYGGYSTDYLQLPTADYNISVTDSSGTTTVATYVAPLSTLGLQDSALVVLASGFLNPANNSNGAGFGIWVALPSGGNLIPLPLINTNVARVQVIHNCADAAAAIVDVWLNDSLLIDNFTFRKATPFIDAPAGVDFDITIQPSNSTDTTNALARFTYNLNVGEKYILVANGTVSATGYNPEQPFNLDVFAAAQEASGNPLNTNVLVYHGATDAPKVDIRTTTSTLVDDISYTEFDAAYLQLPTADYFINVTDSSGATVVASYIAPLAALNLQGVSLVALASGFLNPANNSNGAGFGIWVALPSGGNLIPLTSPTLDSARVQVIHNCADAAASSVDVWLNNTLLLDNFNFRTSTPFVTLAAGIPIRLCIQPSNSTDTLNALARYSYTLTANETYILVAQGLLSAGGYSPNSLNRPFNMDVFTGGQETSGNPSNTNVLVYHGATDAPIVDIVSGGNALVQDLNYGEFSDDYLTLPTANNTIISLKEGFGVGVIASYSAALATLNLQGESIVALASGFINPALNSNGASFGVWLSIPAGGNLIPLTNVTSIENQNSNSALSIFPNPASDKLMISNPLYASEKSVVNIYNNLGEIVLSQQITANSLISAIEIDQLANGLYTVELINNQSKSTSKVSISK